MTGAAVVPAPVSVVASAAEAVVGGPVRLAVLKDKPGRRCTWRAVGPGGTVVVKAYASERAPVVAARLDALAAGPAEPLVPNVRLVNPEHRLVVLDQIPGRPLREAVLAGDLGTCWRVGNLLGRWHRAWRGKKPAPLRPHTLDDELAVLRSVAANAPPAIGAAVELAVGDGWEAWPCDGVVHRDLYEDQVLLGPTVGLIDLDDAALGPPELDLGNLLAHLHLLGRRTRFSLAVADQILVGWCHGSGSPPDPARLTACRRLALLRLACIHALPSLLAIAAWGAGAPLSPRRGSPLSAGSCHVARTPDGEPASSG
jgi:Ser/Thr protein kinase RdoA (MazF antagonist)